jgi:hypothetical protein
MILSPEVSMQDSATFCLGRMGLGTEVFRLLALAMESRFTVTRNQSRAVLRQLMARGSHRAETILLRFGLGDEPEAVEDLLAKVGTPQEQVEEVFLSPEEKATKLLANLQAIPAKVLEGHRAAQRDRSGELLSALQEIRLENPDTLQEVRSEERLRGKLEALIGTETGGPAEIRAIQESRQQEITSRLSALTMLTGSSRDRREIRQAELFNALRSLSS